MDGIERPRLRPSGTSAQPPAPAPAAVAAPLSGRRPTNPLHAFSLAFFIPILGIVVSVIQALDPDPNRKREAPYCFGGSIVGALLGFHIGTYALPFLVAGPAAMAYQEGAQAFSLQNWPVAESAYRRAMEVDRSSVPAWVNLAATQVAQKKARDAEVSARKALDLLGTGQAGPAPAGETTATLRGRAYGQLAANLSLQLDVMGAGRAADSALQSHPAHPESAYLRSVSHAAAAEAARLGGGAVKSEINDHCAGGFQ